MVQLTKAKTESAQWTSLARELHDQILPSIRAAEIKVADLSQTMRSSDDLKSVSSDLKAISTQLRAVLSDVRVQSNSNWDIYKELSEACERLRSHMQVDFEFHTDYSIDPVKESELTMIALEAIANVERHAQATSINVSYNSVDGNAILEVIDNGIGFDPSRISQESFGILGMRERSSEIESSLIVNSTENKGTVVQCTLTKT